MSATYAFDGKGQRKSRAVNGTTTISITDADNREVLEYDGTSGSVLRWYAYGLGPNDLVSQNNVGGSPTRASLIPDMLGSVIGSQDAATGTIVSFAYRSYGNSSSPPAQFGYTGQRIDTETGLYYYRARHYSPAVGRFIQSDPIGFGGGINLQAYASNDPLNFIDPSGLYYQVSTIGNSVTIILPIRYVGAGATQDNIDKFNSGIQSVWGQQIGKYNVTVIITTPGADTPVTQMNTIDVRNGPSSADPPAMMTTSRLGVSYGGYFIDNATSGNVAAHEAGHMMGLGEGYIITGTNPRVSQPASGRDADDIMATTGQGARATERDIDQIIAGPSLWQRLRNEPSRNAPSSAGGK